MIAARGDGIDGMYDGGRTVERRRCFLCLGGGG